MAFYFGIKYHFDLHFVVNETLIAQIDFYEFLIDTKSFGNLLYIFNLVTIFNERNLLYNKFILTALCFNLFYY